MRYDIFDSYGLNDADDESSLNYTPEWKHVATKSVKDSDDFLTEYAWYTNGSKHIFMFGDTDYVTPDEMYADHECETEKEAEEWFSSYNGFDEDADSDDILIESYNNFPQWLTTFLDTDSEGRYIKKNLTNSSHVDLHNARYVRAPFPRSNRDPILKDKSKVKIFKLMDRSREVIYIPGMNNPWLKRPHVYEMRYANDMPMKDILDLAIEFGYVDLTDCSNSNAEKQVTRRNNAYELRDVTRHRNMGLHPVYHHTYGKKPNGRTDWDNILSTDVSWVTEKGYDKSGYRLEPDKYVKMLNNVGLDTYSKRLESFYNRIESVRSRVSVLIDTIKFDNTYSYTTTNMFSSNIFGEIARAVDYLAQAMDYYQRIKKSCAEILADVEHKSEESINSHLRYAFSYDAESLRDRLLEATKIIKSLEQAVSV